MAEEIFQYVILIPAALLSLIAGIILIIRGKEKSDKGMISLGISYTLMIFFLVVWGFNLAEQIIDYTIMYTVYMGVNFFTNFTFYENRKSYFKSIAILTTVNYIILIFPKILSVFNLYEEFFKSYTGKILDNVFSITWAIIVFGWLAYSSIESYNQIKNKKVQPWIKKRLLLVIYSAIIEMFVSLPDLIDILSGRIFHNYVFYIQMIMIATIMVMQFLAWVMPKKLKELFNRGYIRKEEDDTGLSEEEIIKQMSEGDENK